MTRKTENTPHNSSSDNNSADRELDALLRKNWTSQEPPADFSAQLVQVMGETHNASSSPPQRRSPMLAAVASVAAAALLVLMIEHWPQPDSGHLQPQLRTEIAIGKRAIAVAEPGTDLRWDVTLGGSSRLLQQAGTVFYRVQTGSNFVVETPAGTVEVQGTCFTIEVKPMTEKKQNITRLQGAVLGAALSAAIVVTVYEGQVKVSGTSEQELTVHAGEAVRSTSNGLVTKTMAASVTHKDTPHNNSRAVSRPSTQQNTPATARLLTENNRLKDEVEALKQELSLEQEMRLQQDGTVMPFPEGLEEKYKEPTLIKNVTQAMAAAGLSGEIQAVDCSEFPCITFGEFQLEGKDVDTDSAYKKLLKQIKVFYPENESYYHIHNSTFQEQNDDGTTSQTNMFGLTVSPENLVDKPELKNLGKRVRARNNDYFDSTR